MLVGCVVYWSGWDTNWKVFALALAGAVLLSALHLKRGDFARLDARQSAWFFIFVAGLAAISYLGGYGNGLNVLHHGIDLMLVATLSLAVFWLALETRLSDAEAGALVAKSLADDPPKLGLHKSKCRRETRRHRHLETSRGDVRRARPGRPACRGPGGRPRARR